MRTLAQEVSNPALLRRYFTPVMNIIIALSLKIFVLISEQVHKKHLAQGLAHSEYQISASFCCL